MAESRVEKLKKDWPNAALVGARELSAWVWADDGGYINTSPWGEKKSEATKRRKGLAAADCTALVFIERNKIRTLKNVVLRTVFEEKTEKEKPEARLQPQRSDSPFDKDVKALNERMQAGLSERPDLAKRLVVYSFLGQVSDIEMGNTDIQPLTAPWAEMLAPFLPADDEDNFGSFEPYDPPDDAENKLWTLLAGLPEPTIDAMLGRFMSSALGIFRYRPCTGGLHRAIAAAMGIEVPATLIPELEPSEMDDGSATNDAPVEEPAI